MLSIPARPVREDRQAVVDGKGIVAIVNICPKARQPDTPVLTRLPVETCANRSFVPTIGIVAAQVGIRAKTVALVVMRTQPIPRATFGQRATHSNTTAQRAIAANQQAELTFERITGLGTLHIDQTCQRICAVTSALRASQDFDLLNIPERCDGANTAEVNIIDDQTDGRVWCSLVLGELTDTANLNVLRPVPVARPVEIR